MAQMSDKPDPAGGNLAARIAESVADREAAYRLRYEVYVAEQGKPYAEADRERRLLSDELDRESVFIAVTQEDGRPVGTQRSTWFNAGDPTAALAELFVLKNFERFSPTENCVVLLGKIPRIGT